MPGWWQTGDKLYQRLTGRSSDHEPTQPSDGGLSAAHQAEMILQLILDQQRQNAPLQVNACSCWLLGQQCLVLNRESGVASKNLHCSLLSGAPSCF